MMFGILDQFNVCVTRLEIRKTKMTILNVQGQLESTYMRSGRCALSTHHATSHRHCGRPGSYISALPDAFRPHPERAHASVECTSDQWISTGQNGGDLNKKLDVRIWHRIRLISLTNSGLIRSKLGLMRECKPGKFPE